MAEGKTIAKSKAEERHRKLADIRRRRRIQLSVIAITVLAVLGGAVQLYRSGLFDIKNITVSGNQSVPTSEIVEACDISAEDNTLNYSTSNLRKKLLKNPWIKDVTVRRVLPDKLKVEIAERVPVALISHSEKFYLVDDDLFIVAERQYADGAKVPTITDLPIEKMRVGYRMGNESLENAIRCLKSMDPFLKKTITLLSASSVDKLSLYNRDNIEILYGEAKQVEDKNKVIKTILDKQGNQVVFIDVRSYPRTDPVLKRIDSVP